MSREMGVVVIGHGVATGGGDGCAVLSPGAGARTRMDARVLVLAVATVLLVLTGVRVAFAEFDDGVEVDVLVLDEQQQPVPEARVGLWRVDDDAADPEQVDQQHFVASAPTDLTGVASPVLRAEDAGPGRYLLQLFELPEDLVSRGHLVDLTADGAWRSDELVIQPSGALVVPVVGLNLEVVLETADGAPGQLRAIGVEERPSGAGPGDWTPTERMSDRFGRSAAQAFPAERGGNRVVMRVDPAMDVTRQFRVVAQVDDGPPLAQPFTVAADGTVTFAAGEHRHAVNGRRVTLRSWPSAPATSDPEWLHHLNRARTHAGLPEVEQRGDWNRAAELHTQYGTQNQWFAHDEDPSLPGHTMAGRWAAQVGNLTSGFNPRTQKDAIYGWLNSPGHAGWMLNPRVRYAGFGSDYRSGQGPYSFIANLPLGGGLLQDVVLPTRIRYPEDGAVFGVPTTRDEVCSLEFDGSTTFQSGLDPAVCVLHLFALDVAASSGPIDAGQVSAQVRVDGVSLTTRIRTTFHAGHIAVVLPVPLVPDQQVEVSVSKDGNTLDAWSFDTVSLAAEPTLTPVPPLESGTDQEEGTAPEPPPLPGEQPDGGGAEEPDGDGSDDDGGVDAPEGGSAPVTTVPSDVAGTTHEQAILRVIEEGIATGYDDGTFGPGDPVTRAQMATFLTRALALAASGQQPFADVEVGSTHDLSIRALVEAGVTGGCDEGAYCPAGVVTRDQMASFLTRALALEASGPQRFTDVVEGSAHDASIRALVEAGITSGCGEDAYCPRDPVTRGQMAAFLVRALDL